MSTKHDAPRNDALASVVAAVSKTLHSSGRMEAAILLSSRLGVRRPEKPEEAVTLLLELFYTLLNSGKMEEAASMLWDINMFDWRPRCTRDIWNAMNTKSLVLLQGGSSMSKSYAPCVWLFLDWLRDPRWTTVICVGPKQQHLEDNVFSNLSRLHRHAALPIPGEVGDLLICIDRRDKVGAIQGRVAPRGAHGVVLQGASKLPKRDKVHPKFGGSGRVRVFLDELEDMPPLIHTDLANAVAGIDFSDPSKMKIIAAYNPKNRTGKVAELAEPPNGWDTVDADTDFEWTSKRGWTVLRLDPHRSENVLLGEKIYHGLQTRDSLDALREQSGGEDTSNYQTFGRGMFPGSGSTTSAVPLHWLGNCVGEVVWRNGFDTFMGFDLARTGDSSVGVEVRYGIITERRWPGWKDDPSRRVVFPRPRPCVLVVRVHKLVSGDTVTVGKAVASLLRALAVTAERVNFDPGGPAGGAADVVAHEFSPDVSVTWAASSPPDKRVMADDRVTQKDSGFKFAQDAMYYALRRYAEYGFLVFDSDLDTEDRDRIFSELSMRQWKDSAMTRLEPKHAFKVRNNGRSPDFADALALAVHQCRMKGGFMPSLDDAARDPAAAGTLKPARFLPTGTLFFGDRDAFMDDWNAGVSTSRMDTDPTNRLDTF